MAHGKAGCETCSIEGRDAKARRPGETDTEFEERKALTRRLCEIKHKILVLSGKGGVGKSTVAASLAISITRRGKLTGLLDVDLHGPSVPRLLGLEGERISETETAMEPVITPTGMRVVSMGFLLHHPDDALIWRGPLKHSMIRKFLASVEWGSLDYLVVDAPPGTGDEPLSVAQSLQGAAGALIVTTPQALAVIDVRKAVSFLRKVGLPIIGVVENMSGYVCPTCGTESAIFGAGGGEDMAREMGVPFIGRVPMDLALVRAADSGELESYLSGGTAGARAFESIVEHVLNQVEDIGGRMERE